jgi:hypothetical protein
LPKTASLLDQFSKILDVISDFLNRNLYKCERNVFEAALSLLRFITSDFVNDVPNIKALIYKKAFDAILRVGGYIQNSEGKI